MSEIEERLAQVRARIAEAERRSPYGQEVTLVAVTKFHPLEDMEEAIRLGVTQVGENRVQEMEEKRRSLSAPVVWNLQGHLQKNKVKKAVACADLIQSCDSEEILKEIDKKAESAGKVQDVFLEFNISGEESKYGFSPEEFKNAVEAARAYEWLTAYAAEYGFILRYPQDRQAATGVVFEPWHWRYVGTENALAIRASGLSLEEFLTLQRAS